MENTPDLEEAVFRNFTTQFSLSTLKDKNIGLYWPMGYELDCSLIIEHLLKNGIALSFPKVTASTRVLEFYPWNGKDKMVKPSDDKTKAASDDKGKPVKPSDDKAKSASGEKGKSVDKGKETKKK